MKRFALNDMLASTPGSLIQLNRDRLVWFPILLLAIVITYGFWGFSYDDNFITYRYAKNMLQGQGLVYNQGDRVFGTSAPGYALLLAGVAYLGHPLGLDIPHWGTLLSITALLVILVMVSKYLVDYQHGGLLTLLLAGIIFTSPLTLYLLGSEVFLVLACVVSASYFLYIDNQPVIAGLLAGLAMCIRLDAGLAVLAMGGVVWWQQQRFPRLYVFVAGLILGGVLIFLGRYYGTIIPNTLKGKTALWEVPYTLRQWQLLTTSLSLPGSLFLLLGVLSGLAACWTHKLFRRPIVLAFSLWIISHELLYRWLNVWFAPWYHFYLWVALIALFLYGGFSLANWLAQNRPQFAPKPGSIPVIVFISLTVILMLLPATYSLINRWSQPPDPRVRVYGEVGRFIQQKTPVDSRILAMEIGVLGYTSNRTILDLGGLVSPQFTEAKFTGRRAELAADLLPEYIVTVAQDPLVTEILTKADFRDRYQVMITVSDPNFALVTLLKYHRSD